MGQAERRTTRLSFPRRIGRSLPPPLRNTLRRLPDYLPWSARRLARENARLQRQLERLRENREEERQKRAGAKEERDQARQEREEARRQLARVKGERDEARDRLASLDESNSRARQLDRNLWSGFSVSALADLEVLRSDPVLFTRTERAEAAAARARWFMARGELEQAAKEFEHLRACDHRWAARRSLILSEVQLLVQRGSFGEALDRLGAFEPGGSDEALDPEALLVRSNTLGGADPGSSLAQRWVLSCLNDIYGQVGLNTVALADPQQPLTLDNITADTEPRAPDQDELVTVILPVHNAEVTIGTALKSLAQQTWGNLQVIVVDDASSDATTRIVDEMIQGDHRFTLLQQERNCGNYTCRNVALQHAEGAFVTVHDADDWSHPQKIELQVHHLRNSAAPLNLTDWTRATTELRFWGFPRAPHRTVHPNYSSLMFRREILDLCGPWHSVRLSADSELLWRAQQLLGLETPPVVHQGIPLAIGRHTESSLTSNPATHVSTIHHGIRREYREAARLWHTELPALGTSDPESFVPTFRALRA